MTSLDPGVWCIRLYFELITPFFAQHFLTSKLLSRGFPKSPILCKDKLVEGTKLLGLMTSCHFLKTRKLETENVHLNQVFSIRLAIVFYCFLSALVCSHRWPLKKKKWGILNWHLCHYLDVPFWASDASPQKKIKVVEMKNWADKTINIVASIT